MSDLQLCAPDGLRFAQLCEEVVTTHTVAPRVQASALHHPANRQVGVTPRERGWQKKGYGEGGRLTSSPSRGVLVSDTPPAPLAPGHAPPGCPPKSPLQREWGGWVGRLNFRRSVGRTNKQNRVARVPPKRWRAMAPHSTPKDTTFAFRRTLRTHTFIGSTVKHTHNTHVSRRQIRAFGGAAV